MDARSALTLAVVFTVATAAPAQTSQPTTRPAAQGMRTPGAAKAIRRVRPPLIREGSQLVQITGTVQREDIDGTWTFAIDPAGAPASRYLLTLMPSALLGEMEQMIDASAGNHLVFEVTGQVFVYRGHNYLMPTHPPLLIQHELALPDPSTETGDTPDRSGDTTADIIRDLERSVGPVARRGAADRRAPFGAMGSEGTVAGPALEGTILVERRGLIRRTGSGAYFLVFDADAEGHADPPMRLLPCLLLQELETYARRHGERAAVLISGHVYTYRGLNYLRPTLFRIPQDRTRLQP